MNIHLQAGQGRAGQVSTARPALYVLTRPLSRPPRRALT